MDTRQRNRRLRMPRRVTLIATLSALIVGGVTIGVASAAIPDAGTKVFNGCENKATGTSGKVSLLCIATPPTGSGGGGGSHVDTFPGDCRFDDGTPNDADIPPTITTAGTTSTGVCNNGNAGYMTTTG